MPELSKSSHMKWKARVQWLEPHPDEADAAEKAHIQFQSFTCELPDRHFFFAFAIGDGVRFTPVGNAAIERAMQHAGTSTLYACLIERADSAYDRVKCYLLREPPPDGAVIVFACANSMLYDRATAPLWNDHDIEIAAPDGSPIPRLSPAQRLTIKAEARRLLAAAGVSGDPAPAPPALPRKRRIFSWKTSNGKHVRVAAVMGGGGLRGASVDMLAAVVGGDAVVFVEVLRPTNGFEGRSSIQLTETLAAQGDGIVHWAFDDATYASIVEEFKAAHAERAKPFRPPHEWNPRVTLMLANSSAGGTAEDETSD